MKREVTSIREVTSFVLAADLHPGWIDASHRLRLLVILNGAGGGVKDLKHFNGPVPVVLATDIGFTGNP